MSKEWKYINLVGFELEGAWHKPRRDLVKDGSINTSGFPEAIALCSEYGWDYNHLIGELVSKPFSSLKELNQFLEKNYIDETHSCGSLHIHVSFKNIALYGQLMTPEFNKFFQKRMREWGKEWPCSNREFWNRLEGGNRYCSRDYRADKQVKSTTKGYHRYTQLNYCWSFHKTLECRLLPAFQQVRTAKGAIEAYLNCIEEFLEKNPPTIDKEIRSVETEEMDLIEEKEEFIPENAVLVEEFKPKLFNFFSYETPKTPTKFFEQKEVVKEKKNKVKKEEAYIDWDAISFGKYRYKYNPSLNEYSNIDTE